MNKAIILGIICLMGIMGLSTIANAWNCIDSDGGLNYFVAGKAVEQTTGGDSIDYCYAPALGSPDLVEGYCMDDGRTNSLLYTCPCGCLDGACVVGNCPVCHNETKCSYHWDWQWKCDYDRHHHKYCYPKLVRVKVCKDIEICN